MLLAISQEYEKDLAAAKERCAAEREHVVEAGGLCVIGTERHESRRIDNQLRGRSGRQGDPGETQFYLSLEDDLMRLFGGERMEKISAMMQRYDMPDDMPIQAKLVTKAVESAQRKVEQVNFAMRKNVLDYDNVMNTQRQVIYEERNKILDGKDLMARVGEVTYDTVQREVAGYCPEGQGHDAWDARGLAKWLEELTGRKDAPEVTDDQDEGDVVEAVNDYVSRCFAEKAERIGEAPMHALASQVMLRVIDTRWMSYLQEMDYLKTASGCAALAARSARGVQERGVRGLLRARQHDVRGLPAHDSAHRGRRAARRRGEPGAGRRGALRAARRELLRPRRGRRRPGGPSRPDARSAHGGRASRPCAHRQAPYVSQGG